jgi:hypothetical protein
MSNFYLINKFFKKEFQNEFAVNGGNSVNLASIQIQLNQIHRQINFLFRGWYTLSMNWVTIMS